MNKKTIATLPKGIDIQLTRNFSSSEFDCKCTRKSCNKTLIDLDHVVKLQQIRELLGPLKITSAYRCPSHNKKVGGSKNSQHLKGTATDIQSKRNAPLIVQEFADKIFDGVGSYKSFTHIDSRGFKSRWSGK